MDSILQSMNQGEHIEVKAEIFENEPPGFENIVGVESLATDSHIKGNLNENMDSTLQNMNQGEHIEVKEEAFQNIPSQLGSVDYIRFVETTALHFKEEIVDEKYLEYKYYHFQNIDYGHENIETGLQTVNKGMQLDVKEEKFDLQKAHCFYTMDSILQVRENPSVDLNSELRTIKQEVQVDENSLENCDPFVKQNNKSIVFKNTDLNSQVEDNLDAGKTMGTLYVNHEMKDHEERTMECHVQDKTNLKNVKYHPNVVNSELTNSERSDVLTTSSKPSSRAGKSLFESCNVDVDNRIDLPHHCHECGKVFKTAVFLGQHMAKHSTKRLRPHQCNWCCKTFKTEDKHKRHMTTHGIVWPYLCYVCGKEFESVSLRTKHTCTTTQTAELPYQCSVCQKGFRTMFNLKTHRFRHLTELTHQCVVCGKEQKTEREHRVHMLFSHNSERPHQCTLCQKELQTRSDLRRHMISHSTEWPYHCYVCDKRFKKITSLQQHLSCHNTEKPSICFVCGTGFQTIRELRDHANTHSF